MCATVSWVQVMLGQHIVPQSYHPLVDMMPDKELARFMASVSQVVNSCVEAMPPHQAFIDRHCAAPYMAA
jgi:tryptophan halogenase